MIMVIGGRAQGKRAYVRERFSAEDPRIFDGCLPEEGEKRRIVVTNFNNWIAKNLAAKGEQECLRGVREFCRRYPNSVVITEEQGCGIVPVEKELRLLRDAVGHAQIALAEEADEVIRIFCGLPQRIK